MSNRKLIYSLLIILFTVNLILAGIIFDLKNQRLEVIFLDVSQGDSILIKKGMNEILIDGGSKEEIVLEKLGEYLSFWDRKIEAVVATHPDKDHIQGLIGIMENYEIGAVIDNGQESESGVYKKYLDVIKEKKIDKKNGKNGLKMEIGEANLEIIYPQNNLVSKDTNLGSIVSKLSFGENSFLFMGDLPIQGENILLQKQIDLKSNVLKIGHHGSKNSTSLEFLENVHPEDAIISVGKNSYGHPTEEVLEKLKSKNIKIFRTDEKGDIKYDCSLEKCENKIN